MDLATLEQQLSTAISQQETSGGTAGVGLSLANPGALKYADWEQAYGAVPTSSGFAKFPDLASGLNATRDRINQLIKGGASVTTLINTWAPSGDDNTNNPARISEIAGITKLDPTVPITQQVSSSGNWLSDLWGGLAAANNAQASINAAPAGGTATDKTLGGNEPGKGILSWGRVAAFILGVSFILIALIAVAITTGVSVVNNTLDSAGTVGKTAKRVAETAAMVA